MNTTQKAPLPNISSQPAQDIVNRVSASGFPSNMQSFMLAQAKHESANFKSNLYSKYNNAFGYAYYKGSKWQVGGGSNADNGLPIAVYNSVADSASEVVDWIKRRQNEGKFPRDLSSITTPDEYAQLLKSCGYYGDTVSNYTNGLKKWL